MPHPSSARPADEADVPSWIHLRAAGVSVLVQVPAAGPPAVVHWGRDLGELGGVPTSDLLATFGAVDGSVRPRVRGSRVGQGRSPWFCSAQTSLVSGRPVAGGVTEVDADTVVIQAADTIAGLSLDLALQLTPTGLLRGRAGVTNTGAERFQLDGLDLVVGIDAAATHRIELDPVDGLRRSGLGSDALVRDAGPAPAYLMVGEEWSRFRSGQVWQAHVAFSGPVEHRVERQNGRMFLGGGERWSSGELGLGPGQSYYSPWVVWSWGDGLDAAAQRIHDHLRSPGVRPGHPVIFDATGPQFAEHDQPALLRLAEYAGAIGSETFLLDTDWCARVGLDPFGDLSGGHDPGTGAPRDLDGLLERLRDLDLAVGLALRPERVPPGSSIAVDHPEWLTIPDGPEAGEPVLDLSVRPALVYVWERLTKLLDRHPLTLLRWATEPAGGAEGRLRWAASTGAGSHQHGQTLAGYRLLDALRERYPELAIQTGRADLAMAHRAVAAPGRSDAHDRNAARFGWLQLLPPELVEQVVPDGLDPASTPAFRAVSGWFGAVGMAQDLQQQTPAGLRSMHRWLALHKQFRPLLHSGRLVRSDQSDRGFRLHGVVAEAGDEALYAAVWLDRSPNERHLLLEGLDPAALYRITVVGVRADSRAVTPAWARSAGDSLVTTGAALAAVGVSVPATPRSSALLLHAEAQGAFDRRRGRSTGSGCVD